MRRCYWGPSRSFGRWGRITVPAGAAKLAVNIIAAPVTLGSQKFKYTVATSNYKAASGLQYTDSGSHRSLFHSTPNFSLFLANAIVHFDFTDPDNLWTEIGRTSHPTDGQEVFAVDNIGTAGGWLESDNSQNTWEAGVVNGLGVLRSVDAVFVGFQDGVAGDLGSAIFPGDLGIAMVFRSVTTNAGGGQYFQCTADPSGGFNISSQQGDFRSQTGHNDDLLELAFDTEIAERWEWCWVSQRADGRSAGQVSSGSIVTGTDTIVRPINVDGKLFRFPSGKHGDLAEVILLDMDVEAASGEIIGYFENRYGSTFPFAGGAP